MLWFQMNAFHRDGVGRENEKNKKTEENLKHCLFSRKPSGTQLRRKLGSIKASRTQALQGLFKAAVVWESLLGRVHHLLR